MLSIGAFNGNFTHLMLSIGAPFIDRGSKAARVQAILGHYIGDKEGV